MAVSSPVKAIATISENGIVSVPLLAAGKIAAAPADWKELYLPFVHGEPGS